jgi:acetolactate synthase-1/2/3 large subunit
MIKNSDFIVKSLTEQGIDTVFMLSGGGIMHLQNSVKNSGMKYVCNYHEQACIIAAEAYSRLRGFSACIVTFGPGAMNTIAGIASAWYESIPILIIAGQVRSDIIANYSDIRQMGPQESNVIDVVRPITKYAKSLRLSDNIAYEIELAVNKAKSGRPGPVFLEIPLDVQAAEFAGDYNFFSKQNFDKTKFEVYGDRVESVLQAVSNARRPVVIIGSGIRISKTMHLVEELSSLIKCPFISSHTAKDVLDNNIPEYFGIFGTCGNRHANIVLQNSDLILCLGVGLSISKTGFNPQRFAPMANKVIVDIDSGQVHKLAVKPDVGIVADLVFFMPQLLQAFQKTPPKSFNEWFTLCTSWRLKYEFFDLAAPMETSVNPYRLMGWLTSLTRVTDTVITGNGLDSVAYCQAFKVKRNQKSILNGNWGSMGWDLPLSIGAHYATGGRVICITGDGSIMLNIQELLLIGSLHLPVKVFILNNNGYGSIKATQDAMFESNYIGVDSSSGVFNPDFRLLASSFGISYTLISTDFECAHCIEQLLQTDSPEIIEMNVSKETWITPKASSFKDENGKIHSRDLDDMYPILSSGEVQKNRMLALAIS